MNPALSKHFKGGLAALVFFLGLAWLTSLDLAASRAAYSPTLPHWPLGELQPWKFLHHYGEPPAVIAGFLGLLAFFASHFIGRLRAWRGPGLYLFAVLLLGPALLSNTLGKGLCGRPRPSELSEFSGLWEFHRPLDLGIPGRGRSFLSGHASTTFYWFVFVFLLDGWKRKAAFLGVLALGVVMGVARVLQGAHFVSDVTVCGAAMYLVCALCSPLIKKPLGLEFLGRPWIKPALAAFLLSWLALSKPVYEERYYHFRQGSVAEGAEVKAFERVFDYADEDAKSANLALSLERGKIHVRFSAEEMEGPGLPMLVKERVRGMALARGKVLLEQVGAWPLKPRDIGFGFEQEIKGLFWSFQADYEVTLPSKLLAEARLKTAQGGINIAPLDPGRRVAVFGKLVQASLPEGFKPEGAGGHLREGSDPLLVLVLESNQIKFE